MNKSKFGIIFLFLSVLFLFIVNRDVWAYRGSAADFCNNYIRKNITDMDEKSIKKAIEKANKEDNTYHCKYDYAIRDFQTVVFCKVHGSGSNRAIWNSLSFSSYYKNRFNHTGFFCTAFLVVIGISSWGIRSFLKKRK